jgi:hypothetical protein
MKAMKSKTKPRGRPARAEASAKALSGVDPSAIDPRQVLLLIAADTSSPATARVSACKALLSLGDGDSGKKGADGSDPVTALALKLLRGGK